MIFISNRKENKMKNTLKNIRNRKVPHAVIADSVSVIRNLTTTLATFALVIACLMFTALGQSTIMPAKADPLVTQPATLTDEQQKADCYSYSSSDDSLYGTPPNSPDVTKISFAGKTWDIIGSNNTGEATSGIPNGKKGIAGPNNTVTILLDQDSYEFSIRTPFGSNNVYSTSDLKTKMNDLYTELTNEQQNMITKHNLNGGSAPSSSSEDYNGDTIAGETVTNQGFWPLSTKEASSLKVSVRFFNVRSWWLRSPGDKSDRVAFVDGDRERGSGGIVYARGDKQYESGSSSVDYDYSARPASFLNLSSFSSLYNSELSSGDQTITYGNCPIIPQVEHNGYVYDIIDVNDEQSEATLLLSNSSNKKFEYKNCDNSIYAAGKTYGKYDSTSPYSNEYSTSDLKCAMNNAYQLSGLSAEDGIIPRSFQGAETYNTGEGVAGDAVENQNFWPLSTNEAKNTPLASRVFGHSWWLRSPGLNSDYAAIVESNGSVFGGGSYIVDSVLNSVRQASFLNLSSSSELAQSALENISNPVWKEGEAGNYVPDLTCTNGATNYPDCNNNQGTGGDGDQNGNGTGGEEKECTNGAINPPNCNEFAQVVLTCTPPQIVVNDVCQNPPVTSTTPTKNIAVEKVTFAELSINALNVGKTLKLKPVFTPSNATNQKLIWKSSNTKVATVKNGIVTAKKTGTVEITATPVGAKKITITLYVVDKKVKLPKTSSVSLKVGKGQITVKWTMQKGKWKVTKLTLQYRLKGTANWSNLKPALKSSQKTATVKKLKKNKIYEVRLNIAYKLTSDKSKPTVSTIGKVKKSPKVG
jgi:hypothetical protein